MSLATLQAVPEETVRLPAVLPDPASPRRVFLVPGEPEIARTDDGAPDLHLVSTRWIGTAATGDRGEARTDNVLSFRVRLPQVSEAERDALLESLVDRGISRPEIVPLPLTRIETDLVWAPVRTEDADGEGDSRLLPSPDFDGAGIWSERFFALRLRDEDAQLLAHALESGRVLLSVGWIFHGALDGDPETSRAVSGGSLAITLDAREWPRLVRRVDLNEQAPPGYGVLDVYCFDGDRVYEKRVEVEAESVAGGRALQEAIFVLGETPSHVTLRFPVAVRMDRPYRYRVFEVDWTGRERLAADWRTRDSWIELLDVTGTTDGTERGDAS